MWSNYNTVSYSKIFSTFKLFSFGSIVEFALRVCESDGMWGQNPDKSTMTDAGWTNYRPCFNNYTLDLMRRLQGLSNSTEEMMVRVRPVSPMFSLFSKDYWIYIIICLLLSFSFALFPEQT